MHFAQLQQSSRNEIVHIEIAQFNMFGALASAESSGHALASSRIGECNNVAFTCKLGFKNDVLDEQCLTDALTNGVQFRLTTDATVACFREV